MLFLVFLVVACVNGHQTEPGHHVIPYKGKYCIRIIYSYYYLRRRKNFFFKNVMYKIYWKSSRCIKLPWIVVKIIIILVESTSCKSCDVSRQLKYPNDETYFEYIIISSKGYYDWMTKSVKNMKWTHYCCIINRKHDRFISLSVFIH